MTSDTLNLTASIFDIQTLATHDGAGLCTVVFLQGCPLRCAWCANPEGQRAIPQLRWHATRCTGDLVCAQVCAHGAVTPSETETGMRPQFDRTQCADCADKPCIAHCPHRALDIAGRLWAADAVFQLLKKDIRLFWNTRGGVTFSGGEPLLYPEFVATIAERLAALGVSTAVETCGWWEWDRVADALARCDTIFFDLKTLDSELHRRFTLQSNELILANLARLAKSSADRVIVSLPIIPGISDTLQYAEDVAKHLDALGLRRARLLPYHRLGIGKYAALGLEYSYHMPDHVINAASLEEMRQRLIARGLAVTVEG